MSAYTDSAIPGELGSVDVHDLIEFTDRRGGGRARVHFNFERVVCDHCHGVKGIVYKSETGARIRIDDPELAIRLSLVQEGYNLALNEASASRGLMRGFSDLHECVTPDDWMGVYEERACVCGAESEAVVDDTQAERKEAA